VPAAQHDNSAQVGITDGSFTASSRARLLGVSASWPVVGPGIFPLPHGRGSWEFHSLVGCGAGIFPLPHGRGSWEFRFLVGCGAGIFSGCGTADSFVIEEVGHDVFGAEEQDHQPQQDGKDFDPQPAGANSILQIFGLTNDRQVI